MTTSTVAGSTGASRFEPVQQRKSTNVVGPRMVMCGSSGRKTLPTRMRGIRMFPVIVDRLVVASRLVSCHAALRRYLCDPPCGELATSVIPPSTKFN